MPGRQRGEMRATLWIKMLELQTRKRVRQRLCGVIAHKSLRTSALEGPDCAVGDHG
jgi:hypothetical protein